MHVVALALSEEFLYAGSNKGDIRVRDHSNMEEAPRFGRGKAAVKCLVVYDDEVISAHHDHKIRVWRRSKNDPKQHKLATTLPSVKDYMMNFLPPKNYVQVRRHHKALWINHYDSITSLVVGNGVLYSSSWDRSVKVWRLKDWKCLESLNEHIDAVNALAIDRQNNLLYSGSTDTTIKVFQKQGIESSGKQCQHILLATLQAKSPVNTLALSPDGKVLYSGHSDQTVTVWKIKEVNGIKQYNAVGALPGHRMSVLCLCTLSNLVISGSSDKTIRVWRRNDDGLHSCVSVMTGHTGPVKSLCAVPALGSGVMVYSGSMDGDVRVWWVPENEQDCPSSDETSSPNSPLVVDWRPSNACIKDLARSPLRF